MKMRLTVMSMIAIILASCSKNETGSPQGGDVDVAYLSIKMLTQSSTREGSTEQAGSGESDLKTLYIVTFDENGKVMAIPGTTDYLTVISSATSSPDAFKVAGAAKKMMVIANPGPKLRSVLSGIGNTSTYATINEAITSIDIDELVDNSAGFAMINGGSEENKNAGDRITDPLIDVSLHIKKTVDYNYVDSDAKDAANGHRAQIQIERISSKLGFKVSGSVEVKPSGAKFNFLNWTLDAINSTFFPFAEKTLLSGTHLSPLGSYTYNFYTKDPNFSGTLGEGLKTSTVNAQTFDPELVSPWKGDGDLAYCVENTMDAPEQKFGNATRIVVKGEYWPDASWSGDWFNFAGIDYESLQDLKDAYNAAEAGSNLQGVCDDMFQRISDYAQANPGVTLNGTDFKTLEESDLDQIPNGGEVIKNGDNDVIRWYQKGLCYYYYEIRHDDETNVEMAFGKYGVVRNNWYSLTLGRVDGAGTPWYPDIKNPGPGDPDPGQPIDESVGYLGITVEVANWIIWEREIGI